MLTSADVFVERGGDVVGRQPFDRIGLHLAQRESPLLDQTLQDVAVSGEVLRVRDDDTLIRASVEGGRCALVEVDGRRVADDNLPGRRAEVARGRVDRRSRRAAAASHPNGERDRLPTRCG